MKGAADGGLLIPHNEKRFPGFDREHKEHIMGEHVAEYMRLLEEENPGKYEQQFARYIKAGVNADGLGEMYEKIHAAIRAKPVVEKKKKTVTKEKRHLRRKMTYSQRQDRVAQKKKS